MKFRPYSHSREPVRRGPPLPGNLDNRAGGNITVHHVCDRFACYTNILSGKSHVYHLEDERWKWVGSWNNSDHAVAFIKWMRGEDPKPSVQRLEDRSHAAPPRSARPDSTARQRMGVRRVVEQGLADLRKRVREGDTDAVAEEADGLRKLVDAYEQLGGGPRWARDCRDRIDEAEARSSAPCP